MLLVVVLLALWLASLVLHTCSDFRHVRTMHKRSQRKHESFDKFRTY